MKNISKIVISKSDGKRVGYVLDIAVGSDMQKLGYYIVDDESEGEFLLREQDVLSDGGSAMLIADVSVLEFSEERKQSLLGKEVLDEAGNFYGKVAEIVFENKKCVKIATQNCEIPAKFVKNIGTDYIFVSFKRKRKPENEAKIFPRTEDDIVVQIQNFQHSVEPERVRLSSDFYVGKICTQDIYGYNNEKIALSGEIITRTVVEKAKRHNKLNQLFFAIKR